MLWALVWLPVWYMLTLKSFAGLWCLLFSYLRRKVLVLWNLGFFRYSSSCIPHGFGLVYCAGKGSFFWTVPVVPMSMVMCSSGLIVQFFFECLLEMYCLHASQICLCCASIHLNLPLLLWNGAESHPSLVIFKSILFRFLSLSVQRFNANKILVNLLFCWWHWMSLGKNKNLLASANRPCMPKAEVMLFDITS